MTAGKRKLTGIAFTAVAAGALVFGAGYGFSRFTPRSAKPETFTPPPMSAIPNSDFGREVAFGRAIFDDPSANAHAYVADDLKCSNCHQPCGANCCLHWRQYGDVSTM